MSKTAPRNKERGIEATLRDLNIDMDASPEDVAQDAVQAMQQEHDLPEIAPKGDSRVQIPPPPGEDGEMEDEESALPPGELPAPPMQALIPAPQRGPKAKTREMPKASGRISRGLAEKMPGADKVKVYKREDGQKWFIKEYSASDIKIFSDFESFLTKYIKPLHGAGEYDLVGVDANNRDIEFGQIRLMPDPTTKTPEAGAMALVEKILSEQQARDKEWVARMENNKQQSPLDLLTGVLNLTKQLDTEASGAKQDMVKVVAESGNQTMQMFMAMMQQQNQMMMALLTKPKEEDPMTKLLMARLLEEGGHVGGMAAVAMPPSPPPAAAPQVNILEIITAVATLMQSKKGGDDDFKEFLKAMMLKQQNEGLGIKDILALVQERKNGGDEFRSTIDNMAALMNVAQNLNKSENSSSAGIWDAVSALFGNRDFAGGIANAIRAKASQGATAAEARLQAERVRIAREAQILEHKKRQLAALGPSTAQGGPVATSVQQRARPVAVQEVEPVAPAAPSQASLEEVQKAAEQVIERTGTIPQLPANTHDHLNGLMQAKDDAELVEKTVVMFIYFGEFPDWRGFFEQILGNVREGNKKESLEYVSAFFEGLAQIGLIDPALGNRVISALSEHFVTLQKQLSDLLLSADTEVTADALLAGAGEGVSVDTVAAE